jgi:hypothetical protein
LGAYVYMFRRQCQCQGRGEEVVRLVKTVGWPGIWRAVKDVHMGMNMNRGGWREGLFFARAFEQ